MWQFGVGMFLVTIDPTSLRLTAIYGFASGGTILFLGAIQLLSIGIIGEYIARIFTEAKKRPHYFIQDRC